MAPTKLPVTTAVIIETYAKPSNTTSYILFFAFFASNQIKGGFRVSQVSRND